MAVITISKEYGIESEKIAQGVANKLGYEYIGKALVTKIADELNISESDAEVFSKTASARVLRFVDKYTCSTIQKLSDKEYGCLNDEKYYAATKKMVEDLYENGNVVILGWGSQCILKGKADTLHVRLVMEPDEKIKATMEKQKLDAKTAKKKIETEENDMKAYIKHFFNEDWNSSRLYDLIIDMGKNSVDKAVAMIVDNLKHKSG